jgi:adenylyl cyclase-associated protein
VDNTGGCQLYLSKGSLGASITTAKSSEINVLVPGAEPDGDLVCFQLSDIFLLPCLIHKDLVRHPLSMSLFFSCGWVGCLNVQIPSVS